ncbi:MAG: hypothetical protein CMJ49_14850 [Planctomycetaceae bacterium]|nr:hypothetical protein [Planctomycetaceae bacterium]
MTVGFATDKPHEGRRVIIELATAPRAKAVVRTFDETVKGSGTSFLVSPTLRKDAKDLETFRQMCERDLRWAREATVGERQSPKQLMLQTSFYGANDDDTEVLWLLGFNVVGGTSEAMREKYPELRQPGHSHYVDLNIASTREQVDAAMVKNAALNQHLKAGVPFNFGDEVCARPPIGENAQALKHFHEWLEAKGIDPKDLGVEKLSDVKPIELPAELEVAQAINEAAANRVFYYCTRFRQEAGTDRIRWSTESMHKHFPAGLVSSTLVADHPYFGGTGFGMGLRTSNWPWGGYHLALDWFDMSRRGAVDMIGVEDWMGLQYMFGPASTWEGFQLMGFQANIVRSASRGTMPTMSWITPSDEVNLRLKTSSSLAQGAKHFYYWTFGPTAKGTENYWSDLQGEYDGIAVVSRQLAESEHIIAPGEVRKTRVALLYSISSDLWQPFDYLNMLERRGTYFSLIHDQYLVDMITEEDVEAGRLDDYDVLYTTDPCITEDAMALIAKWVHAGGYLYGSGAAGSRNEFYEPVKGLSEVFGIRPDIKTEMRKGNYAVRCSLNDKRYIDQIQLRPYGDADRLPNKLGALGVKVRFMPTTAKVRGKYANGAPAMAINRYGKGHAIYYGSCPGLTYIKEAGFVPDRLEEKWPVKVRRLINQWAGLSGAHRLVTLSHPVVEAGVYDAPDGTALVLANFTYESIDALKVRLAVRGAVKTVRSVEHGELKFTSRRAAKKRQEEGYARYIEFTTKLGISDIILVE